MFSFIVNPVMPTLKIFFKEIPPTELRIKASQFALALTLSLVLFVFLLAKSYFKKRKYRWLTHLKEFTLENERVLFDKAKGIRTIVIEKILPKVIERKSHIELRVYKTSVSKQEIENLLHNLEAGFNCKLLKVEDLGIKYSWFSLQKYHSFILHKDQLENLVAAIPDYIPEFHAFIGKKPDGSNCFINLKESFSFYITGTTGSGKTTLAAEIIRGILHSTPDIKLTIFDAKGIDWDDISVDAKKFDMLTIDGLRDARDFLEELEEKKRKTATLLKEHGLKHAEDLRSKSLPFERQLLVFDEASLYLKPSNEKRKDFAEIKKDICNKITAILSTYRSFSTPTFVITQRNQKDELDIPYENFTNILANGISKEMSHRLTNGEKYDLTIPRLSTWFLRSFRYTGILKTPPPFVTKKRG